MYNILSIRQMRVAAAPQPEAETPYRPSVSPGQPLPGGRSPR